MKTKLYIGQPDLSASTNPLDSHCTCFGTVEEARQFARERSSRRSVGPNDGFVAGMPRRAQVEKVRIRCQYLVDGECSPLPHTHRMGLGSMEIIACDKHATAYLERGWKRTNMICNACVQNEATSFTTDGESFCEECAKKQGQEEGQPCVNAGSVHGCLVHCLKDQNLCEHCRRWYVNPKVRLLTSAGRACAITPGCTGTMQASVRRFGTQKPELFWHCSTCHDRKKARQTTAAPDERITMAQDEAGDQMDTPLNAEVAEMTAHIRDMLSGTD